MPSWIRMVWSGISIDHLIRTYYIMVFDAIFARDYQFQLIEINFSSVCLLIYMIELYSLIIKSNIHRHWILCNWFKLLILIVSQFSLASTYNVQFSNLVCTRNQICHHQLHELIEGEKIENLPHSSVFERHMNHFSYEPIFNAKMWKFKNIHNRCSISHWINPFERMNRIHCCEMWKFDSNSDIYICIIFAQLLRWARTRDSVARCPVFRTQARTHRTILYLYTPYTHGQAYAFTNVLSIKNTILWYKLNLVNFQFIYYNSHWICGREPIYELYRSVSLQPNILINKNKHRI